MRDGGALVTCSRPSVLWLFNTQVLEIGQGGVKKGAARRKWGGRRKKRAACFGYAFSVQLRGA